LGSSLAVPLVLIGLAFSSLDVLINVGILLYCAVVLFQVITLPVEFDASSRAITILRSSGYLSDKELSGAKRVLTAATLTYVAAVISSMLSLLRLLLLSNRRRR